MYVVIVWFVVFIGIVCIVVCVVWWWLGLLGLDLFLFVGWFSWLLVDGIGLLGIVGFVVWFWYVV